MLFALIFRKPKEDDEDETENQLKKDEIAAATAECGTPENRGKKNLLISSYFELNQISNIIMLVS